MASRFWVGGGSSTNWNATANTNWSATSGGANNASVPAAGDDVFFDANSGTGGCVVNVGTANLNSFNMTGCPAGFGLSGSSNITVAPAAGAVTVLLGGTVTWTGELLLHPAAGSTVNFTSAGNTLTVQNDSGTGTIQQQDNLTNKTGGNNFTITGTWVANSHNITLLGDTAAGVGWNNNGTFTAGTGTVSFNGTNAHAVVKGASDSNFYNLSVTGAASAASDFTVTSNQTVTNALTLAGNNATTNRLLVQSATIGTQVKLTVPTTSAATYSNVDFQDIDLHCALGRIDLSAITGLSGDCGGNNATDMLFTAAQTDTLTAPTTTNPNWSTASWSLGRPPLPQDNMAITGTWTSTRQLTFDMSRLGKNVDFTGCTLGGSASTTPASGAVVPTWYGNFAWKSGITWNGNPVAILRGGSYTLNFAGGGNSGAFWDVYLFAANLSLTGGFVWGSANNVGLKGDATSTFNDGGFSPSFKNFDVSHAAAGFALTMAGSWTLTGTGTVWNGNANVTLAAAGSTITLNDSSASAKTFAGAGKTYGNFSITGTGTGGYTFTGANTFAIFGDTNTSAHTLTFPGGVTTTVAALVPFQGSSGTALITLASSSGVATISQASGVVNGKNLSISNSTATGGATFYAGATSTNGGGNTGWIFSDAPTATSYTLTGPGSGIYKSASSPFTLAPNGAIGGTTTITPQSTGAGTFSPASQTWNAGDGSAKTFTYTPTTTAGSPVTISSTNSASLTNPAGVSYAVNKIALTVMAVTAAKRFDGGTSAFAYGGAVAVPTITNGAVASGDTANFTEAYSASTAGSQLTITPSGTVNDGNSGNNYSYTFVSVGTGVILPQKAIPAIPTLNYNLLGTHPFSDWINVAADYGADPTGVSDSTTAIQNAISAALGTSSGFPVVSQAVYFPPGTYKVTSTISVTGSGSNQNSFGLNFYGCGAATVIKWGGAAGGTMFTFSNVGYYTHEGLTLDGNNSAAVGFDYNSAGFITAVDWNFCSFKNFTTTAVYCRTGGQAIADSYFYGCQFQNNAQGITFFGFNVLAIGVDHCDFRGHSTAALVANSGNFFLRNSHFELNALDLSAANASGGALTARSCTSRGSGAFMDSPGACQVVLQDIWVDSWTGAQCVALNAQPHLLFDLTFTNPPNATLPVKLTSSNLMVSNLSSPSTAGVINNTGAGTVYTVPNGSQSGTVTSADQTWMLGNVPVPTQVFDAVAGYGADPTGVADSSTAAANCINAAKAIGGGCAYFKSGTYKLASTVHATGANYQIRGNGFHTTFSSTVAAGSPASSHSTVWLDSLSGMTVKNITFAGSPSHHVYVSGATQVLLDRIINSGSPPGSDVYLDSLSSGSTAVLRHVLSPVYLHDCGSAKVLIKFLLDTLTVDGTSSATVGNLGCLEFDGGSIGGVTNQWTINDGQSFVCGDFYVEQVSSANNMLSMSGGKSNTQVTVDSMKVEVNSGANSFFNVSNATSFSPQLSVMLGPIPSNGAVVTNFDFTNSGTGSIVFLYEVGSWNNPITTNVTGTVVQQYQGNTGANAPADTTFDATAQSRASLALDHLRLLRVLDAGLADPIGASSSSGGLWPFLDVGLSGGFVDMGMGGL